MLRAFALSLGQLGDPRILRVLAKTLAVTIGLFVLLGVGVWWGTGVLMATSSGTIGVFLAVLATGVAFWLLFRAVAIGVIWAFADQVVAAVEAKHYPGALASARGVSIGRSAAMGLGSAARVIGVNLLLLPIYIALLVTGVGTAALFFVANGWLLGRDLGEMVAARHMDAAAMRGWRKTTGPSRFLLGLAVTGLFVVPVVNILAGVLGAAMATHLFHARRILRGRA